MAPVVKPYFKLCTVNTLPIGGREGEERVLKQIGRVGAYSFPSRAKDNLYEMSVPFWTLMERTGVQLGIETHALMTQSLRIGGWSLAKPAKTKVTKYMLKILLTLFNHLG